MSLFLAKKLYQGSNPFCDCSNKHDYIVQGSARGHDEIEGLNTAKYIEFGEEKDVDRIALRRSWVAVLVGDYRQAMPKVVTDSVAPEPDPVNTDGGEETKSTVRSNLPKATDRFGTLLGVMRSSIAPQAEDAEDEATAKLHEDKAVYVS